MDSISISNLWSILEFVHLLDLELIWFGNLKFDLIPYRGFDLLHLCDAFISQSFQNPWLPINRKLCDGQNHPIFHSKKQCYIPLVSKHLPFSFYTIFVRFECLEDQMRSRIFRSCQRSSSIVSQTHSTMTEGKNTDPLFFFFFFFAFNLFHISFCLETC